MKGLLLLLVVSICGLAYGAGKEKHNPDDVDRWAKFEIKPNDVIEPSGKLPARKLVYRSGKCEVYKVGDMYIAESKHKHHPCSVTFK